MHYTGNLYRLVSVNLFEQIRLSHKSFKLETLKDIRGDIVRFYIPHTHTHIYIYICRTVCSKIYLTTFLPTLKSIHNVRTHVPISTWI